MPLFVTFMGFICVIFIQVINMYINNFFNENLYNIFYHKIINLYVFFYPAGFFNQIYIYFLIKYIYIHMKFQQN